MRWPATWLSSEKAYLWILLLATLVSLPSLFCGWMNDDYLHNLIITGRSPAPAVNDVSLYGQFSFVSGGEQRINKIIDLGAFPWWTDTTTKIAFFRPLSELTHGLDYKLWPDLPVLMHAQNILWYLVLMFFAYRCFKLIFGDAKLAAGLSLFLYALDGSNGITVGWIANRNALLASAAALCAFGFHLRNRQQNDVSSWIAPVLFLVSLLCAEYGISLLALLFSYALFLDKAPLRSRAISLLPYFLILIVWAAFYRSQGFGTHDSGMYLDPIRQTGIYLSALPDRLLLLIVAQFNAIPIVIQPHTLQMTHFRIEFFIFILVMLIPTLLRSVRARFFLVAAVLSLLPVAAAYPEDRVLLFSGFSCMGLLAEFFITWFVKANRPQFPKAVAFVYGFFTWFLLLIHAVISPLSFIPTYQAPFASLHKMVDKPALALPYDQNISDKTAIFINPPLAMLGSYFTAVRLVNHLPVAAYTYFLASSQGEIYYEKVNANSIKVTPEGGFLLTDFDYYSRAPDKLFKVGDKLHLSAMDVEITQVGPKGEPMQAIFSFPKPLDDPSLVWIEWQPDTGDRFSGQYRLTQPQNFLVK